MDSTGYHNIPPPPVAGISWCRRSKSFSCVHNLKTADGKKLLFPDYELNAT